VALVGEAGLGNGSREWLPALATTRAAKMIVVILPDTGERCITTDLFQSRRAAPHHRVV